MIYESAKTPRGNIGVSYESQAAADLQAAAMDKNDCSGCHGCTDCHDCTDCHGCTDCHDCSGCSSCRYCTDCTDCHGCTDCSGCTNTQGALRWNGEPAKNLLSLNGLIWPVSTDGKSIQIGCQHHSVDEWRAFGDRVIAEMDEDALTFWKKYKLVVLDLAEFRRLMEEESLPNVIETPSRSATVPVTRSPSSTAWWRQLRKCGLRRTSAGGIDMKTRYYACVDGERIVPLGECECFDDADEKSPAGTMWLYDEAGLRALFASIKEELE